MSRSLRSEQILLGKEGEIELQDLNKAKTALGGCNDHSAQTTA